MDPENYLCTRVDDQIDWYSRKSKVAQNYYKSLRAIEIIAAAAIPVLAGLVNINLPLMPIIAVLGALISILAAVNELGRYQQHWVEYRAVSEQLKREKYLYLCRSEPYDDEQAFHRFVRNIEQILMQENGAWRNSMRNAKAPSSDTTAKISTATTTAGE